MQKVTHNLLSLALPLAMTSGSLLLPPEKVTSRLQDRNALIQFPVHIGKYTWPWNQLYTSLPPTPLLLQCLVAQERCGLFDECLEMEWALPIERTSVGQFLWFEWSAWLMKEWMKPDKARGPVWAISTPNNDQVLFPLRNPLETCEGWMKHQYDTENNQQLEREHPFLLSLSRRLSQKKRLASLLHKNHAKPFPRNFRRMGTSEKPARTQSFFSDHMNLRIEPVAA